MKRRIPVAAAAMCIMFSCGSDEETGGGPVGGDASAGSGGVATGGSAGVGGTAGTGGGTGGLRDGGSGGTGGEPGTGGSNAGAGGSVAGAAGSSAGAGGSSAGAGGSTAGAGGSTAGAGGNVAGAGGNTAGAGGAAGASGLPPGCWNGAIFCNPLTGDGCDVAGGATCDIANFPSGGVEISCFPPPNTQQLNEPCNNSTGPFCAATLHCAAPPGQPSPSCYQFCCSSADCLEPGRTCLELDSAHGTLGMCVFSGAVDGGLPDAP